LVGRQARSPRSTPGRRQPPEPNGGPADGKCEACRSRGCSLPGQFCPSLAGREGYTLWRGVATVSGSSDAARRRAVSECGGSGRCFVTPRLVPVPVEMDDRAMAYEPCGRSGPWASRGSRCQHGSTLKAARDARRATVVDHSAADERAAQRRSAASRGSGRWGTGPVVLDTASGFWDEGHPARPRMQQTTRTGISSKVSTAIGRTSGSWPLLVGLDQSRPQSAVQLHAMAAASLRCLHPARILHDHELPVLAVRGSRVASRATSRTLATPRTADREVVRLRPGRNRAAGCRHCRSG